MIKKLLIPNEWYLFPQVTSENMAFSEPSAQPIPAYENMAGNS